MTTQPESTPKIKPKTETDSLAEGNHGAPDKFLGMHEHGSHVTVRTFSPYAANVAVVDMNTGKSHAMDKTHPDGVFEVTLEDTRAFPYTLRVTDCEGASEDVEDPYRFPSLITDEDIYLHGEGTHFHTYKKMGAHPITIDGVDGVHFAVWAPNAMRVSIIGDFNRWDGRHHPMQQRGESGLWELFLPGLKKGDIYKFEVKGKRGYLMQKADPYAFAAELRPRTASVVWDHADYTWNDSDWMRQRREKAWLEAPISVYEVHPGSWRRITEEENRSLTYREMADSLLAHVKEMGFTHIELLPITEHPFDGSWGYQTIGYFAATSRFGSPDDLKFLIDRCHQEGIGVILDWVPAHFPKDGHGLAYFDGSHLYEHADPRKGEHMDWGTLIFNYGRNEVRTFLLSSAVYWADEFHIDGLRVDAVASMLYLDYSRDPGEWVPNEFGGRENLEAVSFLKHFNNVIHEQHPGLLTFAEESTAWPMVSRPTYLGGLGFDFKWNMGWMNDTLDYFSKESIYRKYHHSDLTFSLLYAFTENFILPFSHDEVVHGKGSMLDKMPGDDWQKFANMRLLYALMYAHPGKKLLFMGQELGQWSEWDASSSLDWHLLEYSPHHKLMKLMCDLNHLYKADPALYEQDFGWEGFQWIDFHDSDQSIVSFIRKSKNDTHQTVCVFNLTPMVREGYRIGVPTAGHYQEVLNTDSELYGGGNIGNAGQAPADALPWQGQDFSLLITLPPLAGLYLRPMA